MSQLANPPVLHHRVLACAPAHLKNEISEGIASGWLTSEIRLLQATFDNHPVAVIKDKDGFHWAFATEVNDPASFKYVDKLEEFGLNYRNSDALADPSIVKLLLEPVVDQFALAKAGVLISDHVFGTDPVIDTLIADSTITCVSGRLTIPSRLEGKFTLRLDGLEQVHALDVLDDASVVFKKLKQVDHLDLSGSYYFSALNLAQVGTLKGTPSSYFEHNIQDFTHPFKFEQPPNMTRVVPVDRELSTHGSAFDPNIHVSFAGVNWVALEGNSSAPTPSSFNDVHVWDKATRTVVPAAALVLLESPAGEVARHIARTYAVDSDFSDVKLKLAMRSDENGMLARLHLCEQYSGPDERKHAPALIADAVLSLQTGMHHTYITKCIHANPLSLIYGDKNSAVITLHPVFRTIAVGSDSDMREHIQAHLGSVLGIAPAQSGHPDKVSVLTSLGEHTEVIDNYGFTVALSHEGVPTLGSIADLAPHPEGHSLTPKALAYHHLNKSTLLHVVLNPGPGVEQLPLRDFLPEYGYLLEVGDVHGNTPLTYALRAGNLEALETLAEGGVAYPATDAAITDAYTAAFTSGNLKVVNPLSTKLTAGFDVLRTASEMGFSDAASLLVANQPSLWRGNTSALFLALETKDDNLFKTALDVLTPRAIGYDEISTAIKANEHGKAIALVAKAEGHHDHPTAYTQLLKAHDSVMTGDLACALRKKHDEVTLTATPPSTSTSSARTL